MRTKGISVLVVCTAALSFSLSLSRCRRRLVGAPANHRRPHTVDEVTAAVVDRFSTMKLNRSRLEQPEGAAFSFPGTTTTKKNRQTERGRVLERLLVPVANMKWFHLSRTFRTMLKKTFLHISTFLWLNRGANKKILGRQHVGSDDAGRAASRRPFPAPRNTNGD